jgi:death-on-curing protein
MNEPYWLNQEISLMIHGELLARFGGLEGIRDQGLLESSLDRPRQAFHCVQPTIFELAAAYSHGLVKNHPFLDGNKRIGFMATYTFLGLNGYQLTASLNG